MPKNVHDGLLKRCVCPSSRWTNCVHPWVVRFHSDGRAHLVAPHKFAKWQTGTVMPKTHASKLRQQVVTAAKYFEADQLLVATAMDAVEQAMGGDQIRTLVGLPADATPRASKDSKRQVIIN